MNNSSQRVASHDVIDARTTIMTTNRERQRFERDRMTCIVQSMIDRLSTSHTTHDDDCDDTIRECVDACYAIVERNHCIDDACEHVMLFNERVVL